MNSQPSKQYKEIIFFILLILGVLFLASLVSHLPTENPFSGGMILEKSDNYLGVIGSYIADFSLSIFGFSAYIIAISLIWLGFFIFIDKFRGINTWNFALKLPLFLLFIVTSSGLFNSVISELAGGWLGLEINKILAPLFGVGVNAIYLAIMVIIFSILTGHSWFNGFVVIFNTLKIIAIKTWNLLLVLSNFIKKLHQKKQEKKSLQVEKTNSFKTIIPNNIASKIIPKTTTKATIEEMPEVKKTSQIIPPTGSFLPVASLLDSAKTNQAKYSESELQNMAENLVEKLADFNIIVEVTAITPGPVITSFEISLPPGIKASKVVGLDKDLARALLVESVRILDVIPGKPVIGVEIPNSSRQMISLSEVIESAEYTNSTAPLTMCLGKGTAGNNVVMDLAKTPHLLVAGATGMGKSVGLNAMLMGILFKSNPRDVRLIMIDPKVVELAIYADIPHLLTPVVTDMNEAASSLFWCVGEMERRYALLAKFGVRNISGFNEKIQKARENGEPLLDPNFDANIAEEGAVAPELEELPLIVIIIDEYADMLGALAQEDRAKSKRTESFIIRIAQKARAAGMHLIIATQRPSVDVITGLIKSNVPSRVAFKVSSKIDSRTILDAGGAEQLLGLGDMLYMMPGKSHPTRVHGAFVSDGEITRVVENLKENYPTNYIDSIVAPMEEVGGEVSGEERTKSGEEDPLYDEAVEFVTSTGKVSISSIQRRLRIGYNRSARIVEDMEAAGVVSSMNSGGQRQVLAPSPI
jgi:S-DNA-T family DNA segregation ATPase FtsK/SpoIIIE